MASTDSKREAAVEHSESFDCPDLPCKAVTVYSDRAEAGSNEVLIKKLPSSVDSESIRVEGRGNASICKVQYQEKHVKKGEDIRHRQKICEDQLEKLNEDRDKVEAEMKRLQRQREVLDGIAQQISRGSRREEEKDKSKGFLMEAENLESLEKFLNFYENKVGQLDDSIRVVAKKLAKIDEEIDVVKKNIRDLSGGSAGSFLCREVSIIVETSETCDVELDVSYVVSNAMWTPSYDFRVLSDASSMKVHYYGMIQQNSGEDWVDTTLSLSTAKPSIGGQVPELRTQRVSIYHVRDFVKLMDPTFGACFTFNWNMTKNLTTSRAGPMYGLRVLLFVNGSEYLPTTEAAGVRITVHEKTDYPFPDTFGYSAPTGFISSFGIRLKRVIRLPAPFGTCVERENIKTDYIYEGFDYSVEGCFRTCFQQLVTRECGCCDPRFPQLPGYKHCAVEDPYSKPAFEYETVPSKTPYAFLKARVTNKSAYPFLPGPISVFLDNNFVAKSHLAAVSPLEEFTCSLGIDPAVRVEYKPIHKYREESGLWTKSTLTTYEQKIEIKNTRVGEKRAKVKLLEHVPLSGGKKVKVNLLEPHIPKHDKEAEKLSYRLNKDRNLEWDLRVDPGETKVVTVKYTIEHPKNDVIEFSED